MDYSPWSSKNLIDRNRLKKFVQVGVDETYMHTNFGGCGFPSFGDTETLKNGQISFPTHWLYRLIDPKWRMTLIWCVVVATDSNACVRAALVLKPGAHVPTAYQIVLDAVIIALVSHARLLERLLCLRRWLCLFTFVFVYFCLCLLFCLLLSLFTFVFVYFCFVYV